MTTNLFGINEARYIHWLAERVLSPQVINKHLENLRELQSVSSQGSDSFENENDHLSCILNLENADAIKTVLQDTSEKRGHRKSLDLFIAFVVEYVVNHQQDNNAYWETWVFPSQDGFEGWMDQRMSEHVSKEKEVKLESINLTLSDQDSLFYLQRRSSLLKRLLSLDPVKYADEEYSEKTLRELIDYYVAYVAGLPGEDIEGKDETYLNSQFQPLSQEEISQERFEKWLKATQVIPKSIKKYIPELQRLNECKSGRLFSAGSIAEVERIGAEIRCVDGCSTAVVTRALRKYVEFLRCVVTKEIGEINNIQKGRDNNFDSRWQPFADWMSKRGYSGPAIRRCVYNVDKVDNELVARDKAISLLNIRDEAFILYINDLMTSSNGKAINRFFVYVRETYGNVTSDRKELVLGDQNQVIEAYKNWLISQEITEASSRNYVRPLYNFGKVLGNENIFWEAESISEIVALKEQYIEILTRENRLHELKVSDEQMYDWFLDFLADHKVVSKSLRDNRLTNIIKRKYNGVIDILDHMTLASIFQAWRELYAEQCPYTPDEMRGSLNEILVQAPSSEYYLMDTILNDEIRESIEDFCDQCFPDGNGEVYYEAIIQHIHDSYPELSHIWNEGNTSFLVDLIRRGLSDKYRCLTYKLELNSGGNDEARVKISELVCQFMREQNTEVQLDEIAAALPSIPRNNLERVLLNHEGPAKHEIVCTNGRNFFHVDMVKIDKAEWEEFIHSLDTILLDSDLSQEELFKTVQNAYPEWLRGNPIIDNTLIFFKYVRRRLGERYRFNRSSVTYKNGEVKTIAEKVKRFCEEMGGCFTMTELTEKLNQIVKNSTIPWDSILETHVRVSSDLFVKKEAVYFQVKNIDDALESKIGEKIATIADLVEDSHFMTALPRASYAWDPYLLEYFLYSCSKKYALLHISFTVGGVNGLVVPKNLESIGFKEALAKYFAENLIPQNEDEGFRISVEKRILASSKYGCMPEVLMRAREIKNKL